MKFQYKFLHCILLLFFTENVTFALSSSGLSNLANYGLGKEVPYLGVTQVNKAASIISTSTLGVSIQVDPQSPAEAMGLLTNDVVIEFNKEAITDFLSLQFAIAKCKPQGQAEIVVLREGKKKSIVGSLGKRGMTPVGGLDFLLFEEFNNNDLGWGLESESGSIEIKNGSLNFDIKKDDAIMSGANFFLDVRRDFVLRFTLYQKPNKESINVAGLMLYESNELMSIIGSKANGEWIFGNDFSDFDSGTTDATDNRGAQTMTLLKKGDVMEGYINGKMFKQTKFSLSQVRGMYIIGAGNQSVRFDDLSIAYLNNGSLKLGGEVRKEQIVAAEDFSKNSLDFNVPLKGENIKLQNGELEINATVSGMSTVSKADFFLDERRDFRVKFSASRHVSALNDYYGLKIGENDSCYTFIGINGEGKFFFRSKNNTNKLIDEKLGEYNNSAKNGIDVVEIIRTGDLIVAFLNGVKLHELSYNMNKVNYLKFEVSNPHRCAFDDLIVSYLDNGEVLFDNMVSRENVFVRDDFHYMNLGWNTYNDTTGSSKIANEYLELATKPTKYSVNSSITNKFEYNRDFRISFSCKQISNTCAGGYGIKFGYDSKVGYSVFEMGKDFMGLGRYDFTTKEYSSVVTFKHLYGFNQRDRNYVDLIKINDSIECYVNKQKVGVSPFNKVDDGIFSFFLLSVDGTEVVSFDDFKFSYLDGCISGNCTDGFGTYTTSSSKYVGDFKAGKKCGKGTAIFPSGSRYVGDFMDDTYHGNGTFSMASGRIYTGEFRNGKYHGQGTLTYPEGDKYVGEFQNDKFHGQGTFTTSSGEKLIGEFKDGEINGQITYTEKNGDKYIGEYKDRNFNGQGTYTFKNGDKYMGEYKDGKRHGYGIFTKANGETQKGEFKNGEFVEPADIVQSGVSQPNKAQVSEVDQVKRGVQIIEIPVNGSRTKLYDNSYALIIGESEYTNGWSRLNGVKTDIPAVKKALESHGFEVVVKENITSDNFDKTMKAFIANYCQKLESRVLIYYAGHGHTILNQISEEPMGYVVPVDAPNPAIDKSGFIAKAVDMQQFNNYAVQIQAKHALFMFDACFAGTIFGGRAGVPPAIDYITAQPVRQFITSGDENEVVADASVYRRQFVSALSTSLADFNKDGFLTGSELGLFLQNEVSNSSAGTQHPVWGKIKNANYNKGDFVFALPNNGNDKK